MVKWGPDPKTGKFPWYRVVWNLLWALPIYSSVFALCGLVFFAHGPKLCKRTWRAVNNA
jgi:hypothetical protein